MLDSATLKASLKPALVTFWEDTWHGEEGMTIEEYADQFSQIIAEKVIAHIQQYSTVSTTVNGVTTDGMGVTGSGNGSVS